MPKNKGKGGKNRRRGKNENESEKRELVFKEDGQEIEQYLILLLPCSHLRVCSSNQNVGKWTIRSNVLRWCKEVMSYQRKTEKKGLDKYLRHYIGWSARLSGQVITNAGEDAERKEPSHTAGGTADWYSHYGKLWSFLRKDNKADVILKYNADEARSLKAYGELPEHDSSSDNILIIHMRILIIVSLAKINETDTFGPGDDDEIQFDDIGDDDEDIDDI